MGFLSRLGLAREEARQNAAARPRTRLVDRDYRDCQLRCTSRSKRSRARSNDQKTRCIDRIGRQLRDGSGGSLPRLAWLEAEPAPEALGGRRPPSERAPAMPALGADARPRAHSRANLVTGQPLVGPERQRQRDGDRPVHKPAQHTPRRGGDHRAASPAPIAPEPQRQRFRAGRGLPGAHHRPLSEAMPDESEPPASGGRARNATAGAVRRTHGPDQRWPVRPKFDVDLEIRDPLIAPLPFVDRCRSTTGTTIGVGSPSPFLSWLAPRQCTASMLAGYRPGLSASKILTMGIGQVSRHSPSR